LHTKTKKGGKAEGKGVASPPTGVVRKGGRPNGAVERLCKGHLSKDTGQKEGGKGPEWTNATKAP